VRSLANPPPAIKLAVEAIAVMLGETDVGWKALRQLMMRETFISTIVNFDTEQMRYSLYDLLKSYLTLVAGNLSATCAYLVNSG